jgi:hypothetical protein
MIGSTSMKAEFQRPSGSKVLGAFPAILSCGLLAASLLAASGCARKTAPGPAARAFDSPQQAAEALIAAAETFDQETLGAIFGPDGRDLFLTGEEVLDRQRAAAFAALARQKYSISVDPKTPEIATLIAGAEDWPLPVRIVKEHGKWSFDVASGRQEILYRRIGEDELNAIRICRGFVEAQHAYALEKHDGSEVNQYAQRIISTPGKQDGLAWRNADGTWGGPVGEGVARMIDQGYTSRSEPFHGYFFRVLKGQGPAAPLGELDFVIEGVMIGGFALVAAPAEYKVTGVMTFIVSHDGIVYQKDLGPGTLGLFEKMERYNPDETWTRTDDEQ